MKRCWRFWLLGNSYWGRGELLTVPGSSIQQYPAANSLDQRCRAHGWKYKNESIHSSFSTWGWAHMWLYQDNRTGLNASPLEWGVYRLCYTVEGILHGLDPLISLEWRITTNLQKFFWLHTFILGWNISVSFEITLTPSTAHEGNELFDV